MLEQLVLAAIGLNIVITLWVARVLALEMKKNAQLLDHTLAAAIQKLIEGGMGEFEPPNPIQAAIAQLLSSRMQETTGIVDVTRSPDGTFSKKE